MSAISPLARDQATAEARTLLDGIQAQFKMVPNIFATMAHAPAVLQHTLGLNQAIHANLDPKLRELAYLTASRINHCNYCEHYHQPAARKVGVSEGQIQHLLAPEGGEYTELEKLVIRFAEQWTRQGKAEPAVVEALAKQLKPMELITLAAVVGLANWTNRFNETFAVQLP
jgi:AhpD family alkylhydroperoxidase